MILDTIAAHKRVELTEEKARISPEEMRRQAECVTEMPPDFRKALRQPGLSIIGEIKKASPSKGMIRPDFRPETLALDYQRAGVQAISVLTERKFFLGAPDYLVQVRKAVELPILRKDFIIDSYQIDEARVLGAAAVLLIAALLDDGALREFRDQAGERSLDVLMEVHNVRELERALKLEFPVIGINNRNLQTFAEDLSVTEDLAPRVPKGYIIVGESGVRTPEDAARLRRAGVDALLIGEAFMREDDPARAVKRIKGEAYE